MTDAPILPGPEPIRLTVSRVPVIHVIEENGDVRDATLDEKVSHLLASQLRVETLVRDAVSKMEPTIHKLAGNPLLSKMFGV